MQLSIVFDPGFLFFLKNDPSLLSSTYELTRRASVKDIIEAHGVPHTEVGRIRYDSESVDFGFIPEREGTLQIDGIRTPFRVNRESILRPYPLNRICFVADVNVIRLGKLMILLGFDVCYDRTLTDDQIAQIAADQGRIVLSRDTLLLKRKNIIYAKRIRENDPYSQLVEVVSFFGLEDRICFFSRCMLCNTQLEKVQKRDIINRLEPKTRKYFNTFLQCPGCGKIYWKGSHFDHIRERLNHMGFSL